MQISVINQSTRVTNDQVNTMCLAVNLQLQQHVAPGWNTQASSVAFYADQSQVPAGSCIMTMLDTPDQAGALGYHAEDNDVVDGFIFCAPVLDNGGVVLSDSSNLQNVSVASVLSHECCEMFGDEFANAWADGPARPEGCEYAWELCDPVEGDSYTVTVTDASGASVVVSVSNFVLPEWFNPEATSADAPFDYLQKLSGPFTMDAGGYMIVRQSGQVQQVFGTKMPDWKKDQVRAAWYRR